METFDHHLRWFERCFPVMQAQSVQTGWLSVVEVCSSAAFLVPGTGDTKRLRDSSRQNLTNFLPVALLIHSRRVSLIFFFLPAVGYNGSRWHLAPGAQNTFLKTQHQFLFSEILTRLLKKSLLDLVVSTFDVVPFNWIAAANCISARKEACIHSQMRPDDTLLVPQQGKKTNKEYEKRAQWEHLWMIVNESQKQKYLHLSTSRYWSKLKVTAQVAINIHSRLTLAFTTLTNSHRNNLDRQQKHACLILGELSL